MKKNKRLVMLYLMSFTASVGPLVSVLVANREKYFTTPGSAVKIGIGALIGMLLLLLKVLGSLRIPSRVTAYGVVFLLSYFLAPLLEDITLIAGAALLGEVLDFIFFQHPIKRERERILAERTASATAEKLEETIRNYIGSGRT